MSSSKAVCVFCGSRLGNDPRYREIAAEVGEAIAARGWSLVYGGGDVGLMGAVADAVLAGAGEVIGVIPEYLVAREVAHAGITETVVVDDLLERKRIMMARADAFLSLPGGVGTLDETLEVITCRQLRQHQKPIALLDFESHFRPFLQLLESIVADGFLKDEETHYLIVEATPAKIFDALESQI
ncbi:MAG: TIGR00730 family Rossman fold protein [Pseudomonadota bacterium]